MDLAQYRVWVNNRIADKPVAYYPVRKAASTSLQHAIGGEPVDMRRVPSGVLKFTMVRNPFDRLASLFANHLNYTPFFASDIRPGMSFDEFIEAVSRTKEPYCDHHLWGADHTTPRDCSIYYFEGYETEFERLQNDLGCRLRYAHFTNARGARPTFTPRLEALVAERYRKDLERFYENHCTQLSSRARGEAAARIRSEASRGTS